MVVGSPGGRTIINTVLQALVNVIDFGMNIQEAIDAPAPASPVAARPDPARAVRPLARHHERSSRARGHALFEAPINQGAAQGIVFNAREGVLEGGFDRRASDSAAIGQ